MKNIFLILLLIHFSNVSISQEFKSEKFYINCGCKIKYDAVNSSGTSISYSCLNYTDKSSYRITVENMEKNTEGISNNELNKIFIPAYLNRYIENLKKNGFKYQEITFKGKKAIKYHSSTMINSQNVFIKAITLFANRRSYTITVTSPYTISDSVFNNFKIL